MLSRIEHNTVAVASSILCAVLFIAQTIGVYQFMSRRHFWIIKKRYPKIVQTQTFVVLFVLLVAAPLLSIDQMRIYEDCNVYSEAHSESVREGSCQRLEHWIHFIAIICRPSFCFVAYLETARLWVISYDLNILKSAQNEEWGSQLTSRFSKNDFYLKNRTKWGNAWWVLPRVLSTWLLVTALTVTVDLVEMDWTPYHRAIVQRSAHALCHTLPLVSSAIIFLKSTKVPQEWFDGLKLQIEFRGTIILVMATAAAYGVVVVLEILGFHDEAWCLIIFTMIFAVSMPSLLSTLWIPLQIGNGGQWGGAVDIGRIDVTHGVFGDHQKTRNIRKELLETFHNAQKLDILMHWMGQEFCIESMLCLIEMAQFKEHLIEHIERRNRRFAEQNAIRNRFRFHERVPLSSIVFSVADLGQISSGTLAPDTLAPDTRIQIEAPPTAKEKVTASSLLATHSVGRDDSEGDHGTEAIQADSSVLDEAQMEVFKAKTRRLFRKYIDSESPMEINISGALRARFYHFDRTNYAVLNELDLVRFFDEVLMEMMLMVQQSYVRLIGHSKAVSAE